MLRRNHFQAASVSASVLALVLGGCGGSDASSPNAAPASVEVTTSVVDGRISNALVCLDRNSNGACDSDEPQGRTDGNGKVTLTIPAADAGKYPIVARVGTDAIDADHGPVGVAFTLSAPADQSAVVSPLTTLVQLAVASTGATSADAAASLQSTTGLSVSPFADYTQSNDTSGGSLKAATLARIVVLTAQQQASAVAAAVGTTAADGTTITQSALDRTVSTQLLSLLPAMVSAAADPGVLSASGTALETKLVAAVQSIVAGSGLTPASAAVAVAAANPQADPATAPAAGIQLNALNYTDSANYYVRLLTFSLAQNTPDATGRTRFVDRRLRSSAGVLAKWGTGSDPWRNADLHWSGSAWVACGLNFESWSTARDAQGRSQYDYCGGLETGGSVRSTIDISGRKMSDVYAELRAAGNTNITIQETSAFGSATFPSGAKIFYHSNVPVTQAIAYYPAGASNPPGTSNVVTQYSAAVAAGGIAAAQAANAACNSSETNTAGSNSTTLESLIASKPGTPCVFAQGSFTYGGATYTSDTPNEWWSNSTVSLGKLGSAPVNSGPAPGYYTTNTLLRVAFAGSGDHAVTYYACKERFNNGSVRNCTQIGTGTYAIATLGDARVLTFANLPAQAAGLTYNRVFVERGGAVYFGYQNKPTPTQSARFNTTASNALLTQLGVPAEDPSLPLALTAASYQGTWDARDVNEQSATAGTTIFVNGNGSVFCQDRPSGASHACTLTVDDPASGHFTVTATSGSTASGTFDFLAGTASGTYRDPTSNPADGSFVAYRR